MIPQRHLNHHPNINADSLDEQDTKAAQIARYSMSLHEYTQQLWQESRRRAEVNASRAGGRKHRQSQANSMSNVKK
ncbi:hypothetical protein Clacol_003628 [Clathrus columnatus]|uniref:Uncharacterized protein n=1 Tax=Clathrus columnatus TaxID=1419009 RepID=A0AAV5A425_9AGAM|nr:hypothetical protein Clacol_003628 [Clathrus columnatus]